MKLAQILPPEYHSFARFDWAWQVLAALAINILSLALPIMMLQVYDRIIPHQSYGTLAMLTIGILIALALDAGLRTIRAYLMGWKAAASEHKASCQAVTHVFRCEIQAFEKGDTGKHLQNIAAFGRLRDFYSGQSLMALVDLPFVLLYLALIAYLGHLLVLVPLALLFLFCVCAGLSSGALFTRLEQRAQSDEQKSSYMIAVLKAIHSVKALAVESFLFRGFEKQQENVTKASYTVARSSGVFVILSACFGQLALFLTVTAGCFLVIKGSLSIGGLSACVMLAGRAMQPVQRVLGTWLRMQDAKVARGQATDLFTLPLQKHQTDPLPPAEGRLQIENMSFRDDKGDMLLDDVSLHVSPGEAIAIYGDKGRGKSALLQLFAGLLVPSSGTIRIDGVNPALYNLGSLSGHIGYLPEEGLIFKGTILENIVGFRDDDLSIARAKAMGRELGLDDIVNTLPKGYQTFLADNPADPVPPGVKQRIALARVLMHEPRLLVFDNADRALDKEGYNSIFRLMGKLKGKTTLIILSDDRNLCSLADKSYDLIENRLIRHSSSTVQYLSYLSSERDVANGVL